MSVESGLISEYIGSNGFPIGILINGFLVVPPLGGIIWIAPNGKIFMQKIGNDGRVGTTQVTL